MNCKLCKDSGWRPDAGGELVPCDAPGCTAFETLEAQGEWERARLFEAQG